MKRAARLLTNLAFLPTWYTVAYVGLQLERRANTLGVDSATGAALTYAFGEAEILIFLLGLLMGLFHTVALVPMASRWASLSAGRRTIGSMVAGGVAATMSVVAVQVLATLPGLGAVRPVLSFLLPAVLATWLSYAFAMRRHSLNHLR